MNDLDAIKRFQWSRGKNFDIKYDYSFKYFLKTHSQNEVTCESSDRHF